MKKLERTLTLLHKKHNPGRPSIASLKKDKIKNILRSLYLSPT